MITPTQTKKDNTIRIMSVASFILLVAIFTFVMSRTLIKVPENSKAIINTCNAGNSYLQKVNDKFAQLNSLFDASIQQNKTEPPSKELLELYEEYKKPIPLLSCDHLKEQLK